MRRSPELAEDDRLIGDSARRWLEKSHPWPSVSAMTAADFAAMAGDGWLAMGLSPELGGNGADRSQCLMVVQEAGRVQLCEDLVSPLLLLPEVAERVPPDLRTALTDGIKRLGFAPVGRQDTAHSAVRVGLAVADWVLISSPVRVMLVPAECLSREDTCLIDRRPAARVAIPDGLPDGAVALAEGMAAATLHAGLTDLEAFGAAADALGAFEAAFEVVIDYLKTRRQFGQPLSGFQAVQQHMANAFAAQEAFRSLVGAAALTRTAEDRATLRRHLTLALRNRLLPAGGLCIQVTGGIGMTEDFIAGHMYRRLQTTAALVLAAPTRVAA